MSADALPAENIPNNRQDRRFPRACRLLAARQYEAVFTARKTLRGKLFVLHYQALSGKADSGIAGEIAGPRLGLVIPKKQARNAVLRNAVKRQAREIFRMKKSELPALDLVLRLNVPLDKPKRPAIAQDKQARALWREEIIGLFADLARKLTLHRPASNHSQ